MFCPISAAVQSLMIPTCRFGTTSTDFKSAPTLGIDRVSHLLVFTRREALTTHLCTSPYSGNWALMKRKCVRLCK
jgi:hypothetical protein